MVCENFSKKRTTNMPGVILGGNSHIEIIKLKENMHQNT